MFLRNSLIAASVGLGLFAAMPASARIDIGVNIGGPAYYQPVPVMVAPAPVYVERPPAYVEGAYPHYYDRYHRDREYWYWKERREHDWRDHHGHH